jgi:hypothetical protein
VLIGRVADAVPIPDDTDEGERLKTILMNCVGNLKCPWTNLRCENEFEDAAAGVSIQSCAYDSEVCSDALPLTNI